jgi:hypothetical protein
MLRGPEGLNSFVSGLHLSPSMYFTFAEHNRTFQSVGVWIKGTANVTGLAKPKKCIPAGQRRRVETLDVPPGGALAEPRRSGPAWSKTVMLSYGYWQRRLAGMRRRVGRSIEVDSAAGEIVGVMPRGFRWWIRTFDLLVPLASIAII